MERLHHAPSTRRLPISKLPLSRSRALDFQYPATEPTDRHSPITVQLIMNVLYASLPTVTSHFLSEKIIFILQTTVAIVAAYGFGVYIQQTILSIGIFMDQDVEYIKKDLPRNQLDLSTSFHFSLP